MKCRWWVLKFRSKVYKPLSCFGSFFVLWKDDDSICASMHTRIINDNRDNSSSNKSKIFSHNMRVRLDECKVDENILHHNYVKLLSTCRFRFFGIVCKLHVYSWYLKKVVGLTYFFFFFFSFVFIIMYVDMSVSICS